MMTLERLAFDLLIQSTLVGLVIFLLARALPLRRAARRRCLLLTGLVSFALLPLLAALPDAWRIRWTAPTPWLQRGVLESPSESTSTARTFVVDTARGPREERPTARSTMASSQDVGPALAKTESTSPAAVPVVADSFTSFTEVLTVVWILGSSWLLLRLGAEALALRRLQGSGDPASAEERAALARAARSLGVLRLPELRTSETISQPMVLDIRRPMILIPTDLADELPAEGLQDILVHELAHLRRGDLLTGWLQRLVSAILWPQPFVHWLSREIEIAREVVCDDDVIRTGGSPSRYARALLTVAERLRGPRLSSLVALALRGAGDLERRTQLTLDPARERPERVDRRARLLVGFPLVLAVGLSSLFCSRPDEPRSSAENVGVFRTEKRAETDDGLPKLMETVRRRALFVQHAPGWEYRYLKNLLLRDFTWEHPAGTKNVLSLQTWLTSADIGWSHEHSEDLAPLTDLPEDLSSFDLIILGDVDVPTLGWEWENGLETVVRWVQSGGSLLILPGARDGLAVYSETPLARALPIDPLERLPEDGTPIEAARWTDAGRKSSLYPVWEPEEDRSVLKTSDLARAPTGVAGRQAEVLITQKVRPGDSPEHAIVARRRCGGGSIAVIGLAETWRLRHPKSPIRHDDFWHATIAWAMGD